MAMNEAWPDTYDNTSIPTWIHSQNSLAAETLSLKICSHGTTQIITKTVQIGTKIFLNCAIKRGIPFQGFIQALAESHKNCLDCLERTLFILFLPLGFINDVKRKITVQGYLSYLYSAIFVLNKITASIFQIIHIRNKTLDPCVNGQGKSWKKA